ncbi:MAG: hypothetical protein HY913_24530 [Desulfomonile tiedjei]|nr:hypothetical protein [Desulfomonile tiedjei]
MSRLRVEKVVEEIDAIHRELARLTVNHFLGTPSALNAADILESHPTPLRPKTVAYLRQAMKDSEDSEETLRIERVLFGCMDLTVEEQTASLADMLKFYFERGRMIIGQSKIPAVEVVPWLQTESDFDKREEMRKENTIFLKGIINPMLMGMLELSIRTVTERFGFANYARFSEAKKGVSFEDYAGIFERFLEDTSEVYYRRMTPWVEDRIGRPFEGLSRYHALHLLRLRELDEFFPLSALRETVGRTFQGLGFDPWSRPDVIMDVSDGPTKNPNGICIGVEIPGEIYVLAKPVGGLIDVETLLHETGHAFFLSNFDPALPFEYRRLYRSPALDETFAFLFMGLIENKAWLTKIGGLPGSSAEELLGLFRTKRLCLMRRYVGKFLAEKELHETGDFKNPEPYCRRLNNATGFTYEPQGYLIDMEPDFYALDYLLAWCGADVLREFLEIRFGVEWFERAEAGEFLRRIALQGRRDSLEKVLNSFCGEDLRVPDFSGF